MKQTTKQPNKQQLTCHVLLEEKCDKRTWICSLEESSRQCGIWNTQLLSGFEDRYFEECVHQTCNVVCGLVGG